MCDHKYKYRKRKDEQCPHDKYRKVEWGGKTYCIFHAPMEAKEDRIDEFWKSFFALIEKFRREKAKEWDFEGLIFPDTKYKFIKYDFPEGLRINFRFTQFSGGTDFEGAQFSGGANFSFAQFKGRASFSDTQFMGRADFREAQFGDGAYFDKAQFGGEADFRDVKFEGWAYFWRAQFAGGAYFFNAQFKGEVYFYKAHFAGEVGFLGAHFSGEVGFLGAHFSGEVGFVEATFGEKVTFRSTYFHSQVDFQSASISELDFTGATFRVQPYLGGLGAASKEVVIENLVGDVVMEFVRGYVSDPPFILQVKGGEIDGVFSVRAPLEGIRLKGTTFRATVNIAPKVVGEKPLFSAYEVNFLGDVSIDDIYLVEMVKCTIGGGFRIAESDLSRAKFRRVDLSRIDFVNVEWTEILRRKWCIFCRWFRKTEGLYDEIELGNKKTKKDKHNKEMYYAPNLKKILKKEKKEEEIKNTKNDIKRVEEMYRAVASAYEGRRRYGQAGHFKAGEFELRRLHASKLERIVVACYRWASFYGEEPLKPLAILLLTIFIPALLYFFNGVPEPILHKGAHNIRYFHYEPYFGEGLKFSLQPLWDFIKSIALSFQACFPFKTTLVDKLTGWCAYLPPLQRGFSAIFIAFLLFALRRKARR